MLQRKTIGSSSGLPAPFIVGTGRCGSTLLRLMLDAHPELCIPPETHFIVPLLDEFESHSDVAVDALMERITSHYTWADFHLQEDAIRKEVNASRCDLAAFFRSFYRAYARRESKPRWGDKTPDYLHRMSDIQAVLPEAHFVHLIRDCRDVVLSVKDLWWGPDDVGGAARWWADQIVGARDQASALDHYYEIRYEDLVIDPVGELSQLLPNLDLAYHSAMLDYDKRAEKRLGELSTVESGETVVTREMRLATVRKTTLPPQKDRVNRWKREMSDEDVRVVNRIAGDVLSSLGYEVD